MKFFVLKLKWYTLEGRNNKNTENSAGNDNQESLQKKQKKTRDQKMKVKTVYIRLCKLDGIIEYFFFQLKFDLMFYMFLLYICLWNMDNEIRTKCSNFNNMKSRNWDLTIAVGSACNFRWSTEQQLNILE